MAKERQREAGGDRKSVEVKSVPADLREAIPPQLSASQRAAAALKIHAGMVEDEAERKRRERETAAQAAKIVGASPRAVEQAARVAKSAPEPIGATLDRRRWRTSATSPRRGCAPGEALGPPMPPPVRVFRAGTDGLETGRKQGYKGCTYNDPLPAEGGLRGC